MSYIMDTEKPILLWVGDDYRSHTGYGRVARELFPYLSLKYKIIQYSIACKGISNEYYIINYNDGTPFGFTKLPSIVQFFKPKIIILLNDSKIIYGWLTAISNIIDLHKSMIIPYVCTEYIGVPKNEVILYNKICDGFLAMAQFTIDEFNKNGCILPSLRLSHGYADTIQKMDKKLAKMLMHISEDTFVFFSGSKNQPRKRLDIIIRAFVHLLTKHSDKNILLMLNCGLIDIGWNLKELYIRLCNENNIKNMEKYIYFCSNNINASNKNDEELTIIYNACDVGITTSTGESFGLIPFEQSALGVPQIISNWGGIIEAIPYGSIKVDTNDYYVYPVVLQSCNGEARTVYYKDVTEAMEKYLLDKELYNQHCIEVLKNVQNYDWNNVSTILLNFIDTLSGQNKIKINQIIKKTQNFINEQLLPIIKNTGEKLEGNIFMYHETTNYTNDFIDKQINFILTASSPNINNILEIGFNSGFSALLMLLSNPNLKITCIDICCHKYAILCFQKMKEIFGDRIDLLIGNSVNVLPTLKGNTYDMIHIDGCHLVNIAEMDIKNSLQLCKSGTILIMDDTDNINLLNVWSKYSMEYNLLNYDNNYVKNIYHDIKVFP